jgi:hypothetical protein
MGNQGACFSNALGQIKLGVTFEGTNPLDFIAQMNFFLFHPCN